MNFRFILAACTFLVSLHSIGNEPPHKKIRDTRGPEYLHRAIELFPEILLSSVDNRLDFVGFLEKRAELIQRTKPLITNQDRSRSLKTIVIETQKNKLTRQKVFDLQLLIATSADEVASIGASLQINLETLLNLSKGETLRITLAKLLKNHPEKTSLLKLSDEQLLDKLSQEAQIPPNNLAGLRIRRELENEVVTRLVQVLRAKNLKSIPERALRPTIRDVLQSFPSYKDHHSLALKMLSALAAKELKTAAVTVEDSVQSRQGLVLYELPADLALIKGLLARDCSSTTCMGYPMSAKERVFLAVDLATETRLGIAVGTMVNHPEHPDFYLHTVNGLRLTASHLELILNGFFMSRQTLGFSKLLLPPPDKIDENVNFLKLAEVLKHYSIGAMDQPIDFIDAPLRNVIEEFSTRSYDSMTENSLGRSIEPTADPTLSISVHDSNPYADEPPNIHELKPEMFRPLLLVLGASGAEGPAQELARLVGFEYSSLSTIFNALKNTE